MSTRLYMPSAGTGAVSPAFDSSWEKTSTGASNIRPMLPWKTGSANATVSDGTTGNTPAGAFDVCVWQGISLKLAGSGTISGNVKGQLRCAEGAAAADMRIQWVLRVVDAAGTTVRGTLFGSDTAALSHEFNLTTLRNITFPRGGSAAPTSVNYVAGDRLVLEIGYRKHENATTSRTGSFSFGDVIGSTDLAEDETTTTADAPWIELADTLSFQLEQSGIPNLIHATEAAQATAGSSLNVPLPQNQDGDLLLMAACMASGATPSATPTGWHYITHQIDGNGRLWLYGKLASGDTPGGTVAVAITGSAEYTVNINAYRPSSGTWTDFMEAILSLRLEQEASNTTPNVPEVPLPSTLACTLVTFMTLGRGSTTTTPPTGYTMDSNPDSVGTAAGNNESASAHKYLTSPGSASATSWTVTNSGDTLCAHLVLVDPGVTARVVRNYKRPPELENGFLAAASIDVRVPAMDPGDLLVALIDSNGAAGINTPTGWTALTSDNIGGGGDTGHVFTRVSDGTEIDTSVTFNVTSGTADLIGGIMAVSQASRLASYNSADDSSSNTSWDFPALTASAQSPNAVELAWYVATTGTSLLANRTDPSGYSFLWYSRAGNAGSNPCNALATIYRTTASPGAGNFTGVSAVTGIGFHLSTATPYPTLFDAQVIG